MLVDLTVKEFLAETASESPAPGGGSAAALAGALGAALAVMVANLSEGNEEIVRLRERGGSYLSEFEAFIDRDTEAFNAVMASYRRPKNTGEEKKERSEAIQTALKSAASSPMSIAELCVRVIRLALEALKAGSSNAASDAASAGCMAHAGFWAAVYNVRINLKSIKDEEFNAEMRKKTAELIRKAEALITELSKTADEKAGL
ncbi:MAG: cyclodeaminase/cyclohydrolase family protein [Treponema sp.]|jgi:formiminotetrahydrofolate cyclodeaminase|nr:cyclodeaminase/cyclohydrolase family protein [Treponema sp.]